MMTQRRVRAPALDIVDTDKWDGHTAARQRLLQVAAARKLSGLVAVTGDIHRAYAGNLKPDFDDAKSATVGTEFVVSSLSSAGDGTPETNIGARLRSANPHMRFYDGRRGYLVCNFTEQRCEASYRAIDYVSKKTSPVRTIATRSEEQTSELQSL